MLQETSQSPGTITVFGVKSLGVQTQELNAIPNQAYSTRAAQLFKRISISRLCSSPSFHHHDTTFLSSYPLSPSHRTHRASADCHVVGSTQRLHISRSSSFTFPVNLLPAWCIAGRVHLKTFAVISPVRASKQIQPILSATHWIALRGCSSALWFCCRPTCVRLERGFDYLGPSGRVVYIAVPQIRQIRNIHAA